MTQLSQAIEFVEAFCAERGIGRHDMLRLSQVVEELFTNTVEHGHGGDCAAPVRLELEASPRAVTLRYEDTAPPFDALGRLAAQPPDVDAPLEQRKVGGLGILLVAQMAASVRHENEDGWNRWRVELDRRG